jgi:hypothetical protein
VHLLLAAVWRRLSRWLELTLSRWLQLTLQRSFRATVAADGHFLLCGMRRTRCTSTVILLALADRDAPDYGARMQSDYRAQHMV